jgi:two-component system, NarL family, response regulator DesR
LIETLIAEPTPVIREGLVTILNREMDIQVIAALQRGNEIISAARTARPRVALVAAKFPEGEGIPLARALHAAVTECHCAIVSTGRRLHDLQRAMAADLDGFLVHDCPAEFLTGAVRQLAAGNKVIDPRLTFSVLDHRRSPLTGRETEALRAAARGSTILEIAVHLSLSEGTVRNYLSRAITKTGGRNRVDAIRIAGERGWLLRLVRPCAE